MICPDFLDLLTSTQGFPDYLWNPSLPGYQGGLGYPCNQGVVSLEIQIFHNSWEIQGGRWIDYENFSSQKHFPPNNFSLEPFFGFGERFLGEIVALQRFACGNLPEIIDVSRLPRFANKKSRISGNEIHHFQDIWEAELSQKYKIWLDFLISIIASKSMLSLISPISGKSRISDQS